MRFQFLVGDIGQSRLHEHDLGFYDHTRIDFAQRHHDERREADPGPCHKRAKPQAEIRPQGHDQYQGDDSAKHDSHELMAEIFNNFDRQTETRFITALEEENHDAAERIKALMFTFDDLVKLDTGSAQTLMRNLDKDKLAVALKGANETVREFFFSNMSSRAGKMLVEDMQAMGPVRLRDVDEAQSLLVNIAKDLAAKGEILIAKSRGGDDELIY